MEPEPQAEPAPVVASPPVASPVASPVAAPAPGTVEVKEEAKPEEGKGPRIFLGWEELEELYLFFLSDIIVNASTLRLLECVFLQNRRIPSSIFEDASN